MTFLRLQRPDPKVLPTADRVCFAPATLLSFRLQGFEPLEEEHASPRAFLPCRLTSHSDEAYGSEGLDPPRSPDTLTLPPEHPHAFLAFYPLRRSFPPP